MRSSAGARRRTLLLCAALAGCGSSGTKPTPAPVAAFPPAVTPAIPAAPAPPSDAAVLESLDPDIWQDLLELDPDAGLEPGEPED